MKKTKWMAISEDTNNFTEINILIIKKTRDEVIQWLHDNKINAFVCKVDALKKLNSKLF